MQTSASQTGMVIAMLRFSYCAVAVGKVPSIGIAETGSASPLPSMIFAVTSCTNSGAWAGTAGGSSRVLVTSAGIAISCMLARAMSTAW